jgi:hypothetical protein
MSERDPVNSPWVGIKMRRGRFVREVTQLCGNAVHCKVIRCGTLTSGWTAPWLSQWARWAKGAEVVTNAE